MSLYWDPTGALTPGQREDFRGRWEDLLWLNVPGPFWTGETDNGWTGRMYAPGHVLYGGEHFTEFVFRQPRTTAEVAAVVAAAGDDPFGGYGCDGDDRWTPETVRAWWQDRDRAVEHVEGLRRQWTDGERADEREAADGLADFASYLDGSLREDLRIYLFWLIERRSPRPGEPLPAL
ncbi:hypothetical protein [Actinoplanes sp. NBRC 101535]|uniref:hypothetical protein n=1 Tax=Actinoplanes sp. NBRC 101535 TaxID=3032196 RepID=UPI0024A4CC95|nr:hypothetical protein [Actinoplanes sp. NBRC 101535]GLY04062.1 hypothetical protein Acsp01_44410 [Actinoplanes sp. NBRC 101535]